MVVALTLTEGLPIAFIKEVKADSTLPTSSESSISDMMSTKVSAAILSSSSIDSGLDELVFPGEEMV